VNRTKLPRTPNRLDAIPGQSALDEQLLAMIVGLASEATILRARLDSCERLLTQAGILAPDAIDSYSPDETARQERDSQRSRIMQKIFRPLQEAAAADLAAAVPVSEEK
jgi:hypothetical protein